jgi:hypothetical protein
VCAVNLQHNCLDAKCTNLSTKHVWQERTQTDQTTSILEHQPSPHYLLNTFSIHNYQHIHSFLPESLRETPLRVADPGAVRKAAVKQMQGKRLAKKSGGEAAIPPNDENDARPAFDHGPKKQANKARTTGKKPVQPATRTKGAEMGTPQYHPPTFSPPVQNDSTTRTPFQPTSSTGSVAHLPLQPQPHSYLPAQNVSPFTVPSQLAGAPSSLPAH